MLALLLETALPCAEVPAWSSQGCHFFFSFFEKKVNFIGVVTLLIGLGILTSSVLQKNLCFSLCDLREAVSRLPLGGVLRHVGQWREPRGLV